MINNYILRITAHQRFYQVLVTHLIEDITERRVYVAECRTLLQFTRSAEVHPYKNKPHQLILQLTTSLTPTLKLLNLYEWEVFMAAITKKLVIYVFSLTQYTVVAFAFSILHFANYSRPITELSNCKNKSFGQASAKSICMTIWRQVASKSIWKISGNAQNSSKQVHIQVFQASSEITGFQSSILEVQILKSKKRFLSMS